RIKRVNRIPDPKCYMYNEIYSERGRYFITIIVIDRKDTGRGTAYYPFMTLEFESISANPA
ncbi:MAG: hypothetical protein PQJ60_13830, partial [Spirochaetales bacterium]|nr:hypothetical protein [Spirochaetales bacterium]